MFQAEEDFEDEDDSTVTHLVVYKTVGELEGEADAPVRLILTKEPAVPARQTAAHVDVPAVVKKETGENGAVVKQERVRAAGDVVQRVEKKEHAVDGVAKNEADAKPVVKKEPVVGEKKPVLVKNEAGTVEFKPLKPKNESSGAADVKLGPAVKGQKRQIQLTTDPSSCVPKMESKTAKRKKVEDKKCSIEVIVIED
jgi:hypothetical protein